MAIRKVVMLNLEHGTLCASSHCLSKWVVHGTWYHIKVVMVNLVTWYTVFSCTRVVGLGWAHVGRRRQSFGITNTSCGYYTVNVIDCVGCTDHNRWTLYGRTGADGGPE